MPKAGVHRESYIRVCVYLMSPLVERWGGLFGQNMTIVAFCVGKSSAKVCQYDRRKNLFKIFVIRTFLVFLQS